MAVAIANHVRNLEGELRRGRGGKEKDWTDCLQSDTRGVGIVGEWKATAVEAEVGRNDHGGWAKVYGREEEVRSRRG